MDLSITLYTLVPLLITASKHISHKTSHNIRSPTAPTQYYTRKLSPKPCIPIDRKLSVLWLAQTWSPTDVQRKTDLTSLDFLLWGFMKHQVHATPVRDIVDVGNKMLISVSFPQHFSQSTLGSFQMLSYHVCAFSCTCSNVTFSYFL